MGPTRKGQLRAQEDRWGELGEPRSGSRPLAPSRDMEGGPGDRGHRATVPFESQPQARSEPRRHSDRVRRDSFAMRHEQRRDLLATPVDERLLRGARNIVERGLGLDAGETLVLVFERGQEPIAAALAHEATELGARVSAYGVDGTFCGDASLVDRLRLTVAGAQASILVASPELPTAFRRAIIDAGGDRRHGHLIGVTAEMMRQSVRADLHAIEALGDRLIEAVGGDRRLEVRGAPGTKLSVRCSRDRRWHNQSGVLRSAGWTNFPSGEVFTTPTSVDGVLVPDGGVWLPNGRSIGRTGKIKLHFAAGRLTHAEGPESEELLELVSGVQNARRVGQLAFGTNTSVLTPVGALLQDLKMPGLHLTLGYSYDHLTGADFRCDLEIPLLMRRPDVSCEGRPILVRGRYARDLLRGPSFT